MYAMRPFSNSCCSAAVSGGGPAPNFPGHTSRTISSLAPLAISGSEALAAVSSAAGRASTFRSPATRRIPFNSASRCHFGPVFVPGDLQESIELIGFSPWAMVDARV